MDELKFNYNDNEIKVLHYYEDSTVLVYIEKTNTIERITLDNLKPVKKKKILHA